MTFGDLTIGSVLYAQSLFDDSFYVRLILSCYSDNTKTKLILFEIDFDCGKTYTRIIKNEMINIADLRYFCEDVIVL